MTKAIFRRVAPIVWGMVTAPSAKRGTWAAELGTLATAVIMGLLFYWLRAHH